MTQYTHKGKKKPNRLLANLVGVAMASTVGLGASVYALEVREKQIAELTKGSDNREIIQAPDDMPKVDTPTVKLSYVVTGKNGELIPTHCTGSYISPTVIATAKHCFVDEQGKMRIAEGASKINIIRGKAQYGIADAENIRLGKGDDYAAVLTDYPVETWAELEEFPQEDAVTVETNTSGYPGDMPEGTMIKAEYDGAHVDRNWVALAGACTGGQSGSGLFRGDKQTEQVGIVVACTAARKTTEEITDKETLYAISLTKEIISDFDKWDTENIARLARVNTGHERQ